MIEDFSIPGHRLKDELAARLQRCFVERFAPESLPKITPPLWGKKFESARQLDSAYLKSDLFQSRRRVLCLVGRPLPKSAKKHLRSIYMCKTQDIADFLCNMHWSVNCDFYLFDSSFSWFVAALNERIYQMDDEGAFTLLSYEEAETGLSSSRRYE
jgi:hypothetical protein